MSNLKIRLTRIGRKGKPFYRIAVMPTRSKRDGKNIEILGTYDPTTNPPILKLDQKKYQEWLKKGAQLSDGVRKILTK